MNYFLDSATWIDCLAIAMSNKALRLAIHGCTAKATLDTLYYVTRNCPHAA
jgi:hypothetical protein